MTEQNKVPGDAGAEPVAVVGDVFTLNWIGSGPIAPLIKRHGIKVGTKLYTAAPAEAAATVHEGWQMVPVKPTTEMKHAIFVNERDANRAWDEALAAAPTPPDSSADAAKPVAYRICIAGEYQYFGTAQEAIRERKEYDSYDGQITGLNEKFEPEAVYTQPAAIPVDAAKTTNVDGIMSALYRRFKEWSKRGFGPDDVTWCEVKADILALIDPQPAAIRSAGLDVDALSNEIRRVDGGHSLGAGALAEALMPFLQAAAEPVSSAGLSDDPSLPYEFDWLHPLTISRLRGVFKQLGLENSVTADNTLLAGDLFSALGFIRAKIGKLQAQASPNAAEVRREALEPLDVQVILDEADKHFSKKASPFPGGGTIVQGGIGSVIEFAHAIRALQSTPAPAQEGMPVTQEPKYGIRDNRLYNRASGEFIPADEPVFIFRARDRHALVGVAKYAALLPVGDHWKAVVRRADDFADFANAYPNRMKEPDTALQPSQDREAS